MSESVFTTLAANNAYGKIRQNHKKPRKFHETATLIRFAYSFDFTKHAKHPLSTESCSVEM
jgi:hypothetical protein